MTHHPVMPGLTDQILRVHDGNSVAFRMAVDRRDYATSKPPIVRPHEFTCSNLVHYTENEAAVRIGLHQHENVFDFLAKPWWITRTESYNLAWWSPLPPTNWKEVVDANLPNIWNVFDDIGNSSAFNGPSICGPVGFAISWTNILEQYAINRQINRHDVELRVFGTYYYTKKGKSWCFN